MTEALEAHLRRQIEHSAGFFWHRVRWSAVSIYLPKNEPFQLLDIGAGAGVLGTFLAKDRPQATYHFVEPIETLREFLRDQHGNDADATDASKYQFAQFVTLLDVLEHQEDDREFLRQLVERMESGSTLLITVPALNSLWSQWDVALGHFRRYDVRMLEAAIADLPFAVKEISFLFPEMVPLGMLRRRRRAEQGSGEIEDAEFPDLPRLANDVLYSVGAISLRLRRHWHTGTSLFLAATIN